MPKKAPGEKRRVRENGRARGRGRTRHQRSATRRGRRTRRAALITTPRSMTSRSRSPTPRMKAAPRGATGRTPPLTRSRRQQMMRSSRSIRPMARHPVITPTMAPYSKSLYAQYLRRQPMGSPVQGMVTPFEHRVPIHTHTHTHTSTILLPYACVSM